MDKTPYVSIIVAVLLLTCIEHGWWGVLAVVGIFWTARLAMGHRLEFLDEWKPINSSTGSSPKSSSILFWRRPRPHQE